MTGLFSDVFCAIDHRQTLFQANDEKPIQNTISANMLRFRTHSCGTLLLILLSVVAVLLQYE